MKKLSGGRLYNQESPSVGEYNSDANAYVDFRIKALQKIIQYNAPYDRTKGPTMEYVVDVLYALQHLYTIPHGVPLKSYEAVLRRYGVTPFCKSNYASKINQMMAPYSFLFMREAAFVDVPTTQHLQVYYVITRQYLSIAMRNAFIVGVGSEIIDYTTLLTATGALQKFKKTLREITDLSKDLSSVLSDAIYSDRTASEAETTARRTFIFFLFATMLMPVSAAQFSEATYEGLLNALANEPQDGIPIVSATSYHRNLFNEAKRMVKIVRRFD